MELSIVFSDDELVVLSHLVDEHVFPPAAKGVPTAEARQSLMERRVVRLHEGAVQVATPVVKLLAMAARPVMVVRVFSAAPGESWRLTRLGARPGVYVEQSRADAVNRFTPKQSSNLLERVVELAAVPEDAPAGAASVKAPAAVVKDALAGKVSALEELAEALDDEGLQVRADVAAALTGWRTAIDFTIFPVRGEQVGWQTAWAGGPNGGWELPGLVTPLSDGPVTSPELVELTPMSGAALVASLKELGEEE